MPAEAAETIPEDEFPEPGEPGQGDAKPGSDGEPLLLEVGRIAKPHGLRGEVVVKLVTTKTDRLDPGNVLKSDFGALTVERSQPFQNRWIVKFVGVTDRETADHLRELPLFAEATSEPDGLWVHEMLCSTVQDVVGTELGKVRSVIANPASDILELDNGGLIPLRFVVEQSAGRIVVDIPAGLLDL